MDSPSRATGHPVQFNSTGYMEKASEWASTDSDRVDLQGQGAGMRGTTRGPEHADY